MAELWGLYWSVVDRQGVTPLKKTELSPGMVTQKAEASKF